MNTDCDLLIIGAGIHGAAVAREAAARGLRVILIEKASEPAQGTSSKSSKLIHGGLRYLETAQFALVRECLREQKVLLRTAPHLVRRNEFLIPVSAQGRRPAWKIWAGLNLYWLLGGARPHRLAVDSVNEFATDTWEAVFSYCDAQTDDAGLTRVVLASAASMGAQLRFSTRLESAHVQAGGVVAELESSAGIHQIRARALINAAGPWINHVAAKITGVLPPLPIELIRGTHIELPQPLSRCCYVEAPDGRAIFVLPWRGHRLVGTTECQYEGDPDLCQPAESEISYLLECHNRYMRDHCTRNDVMAAWAGLRVLPRSTQSPFARARDAILLADHGTAPRYLAVYGGKLTSHRATAQQVLRHFAYLQSNDSLRIDTARQYLPV